MFESSAEEFESAGREHGNGRDWAVSTLSENSVRFSFEAHRDESSNIIVLTALVGGVKTAVLNKLSVFMHQQFNNRKPSWYRVILFLTSSSLFRHDHLSETKTDDADRE